MGGARVQASLTGLTAGIAVGLLCVVGEVTKTTFGLPLWSPPMGAVALIFAGEATAAAHAGKTLAPAAIWQRAVKAGSAVAGTCVLSILLTRLLGVSALGRAVAIGTASVWMTASPVSGYFPPAGAFSAVYMDQVIANGALAQLGFGYAFLHASMGTVLLLVLTRTIAGLAVQPLRGIEKAKQARRAKGAAA